MAQDEQRKLDLALPPYRVEQLHSQRLGNEPAATLEGLVTHHPIGNASARLHRGVPVDVESALSRSYGVVGGEIQELETQRTNGGAAAALGPTQVLLVKDFMLEDSSRPSGPRSRNVDVPAPMAGVVGAVNTRQGLVDILDRDGGEVIARIRHMDPILVQSGDQVEYGQALGVQNNQATGAIHVYMEVDTRYYQHYENYIGDLVSGRLSIDPDRRAAGIEARPVIDDGVIRIGESAGIVRTVQERLNEEGFRGADNRTLEVDGVYRLSMQAAVINYQQARGLPQTGDIDSITLQEIAPRIYPPAVNDSRRLNGSEPLLPPYRDPYGSVRSVDPGLRTADDPLVQQAESAVRQLEQRLGRTYDEQSACMVASVACIAKANGLSRIDHVLLSEARGGVGQGENLFVVQGDPGDPAQRRALVRTQEAVSTPVGQSLAQLQSLTEVQQRQQPALAVDETRRETGQQMRMG